MGRRPLKHKPMDPRARRREASHACGKPEWPVTEVVRRRGQTRNFERTQMTSNQPACELTVDTTKWQNAYLDFVERVVRDYEALAYSAMSISGDPPGEYRRRALADGGWESHFAIIDEGRKILRQAGRSLAGPEPEILPDPRRRRGRPRKH